MTKNKITLYPSNWLYNAAVFGFLKVLNFKNVKFEISGGVSFDRSAIKEGYSGLFEYHKQVLNEDFKIWGKNRRYPNYIQADQKDFFEQHYVEKLACVNKYDTTERRCSFCEGYFIPKELLDQLKKCFPGKNFEGFMNQREKFQSIHFTELGAALTEVPNAFWNMSQSLPICHLCSFLIIFNHLAFTKTQEGEIFINAPDFGLIWDLNRFAEEVLKRSKENEIRKILGSSLLQWAIRRRTLVGAWSMLNIEVIVKRNGKRDVVIDYFDLPAHITKVLLDYDIASLIEKIAEESIFELVVRGKFSELEKVNYYVLRAILKLKVDKRLSENDPVKTYFKLNDTNKLNHLYTVANLLPELYVSILKKIGRCEMVEGDVSRLLNKLKVTGQALPPKVIEDLNAIAYRLMEQVRLGNKDNVFYMLLRSFKANNARFPDELVEAFKPENDKYFKTLIFSFLAPVLGNVEGGG